MTELGTKKRTFSSNSPVGTFFEGLENIWKNKI